MKSYLKVILMIAVLVCVHQYSRAQSLAESPSPFPIKGLWIVDSSEQMRNNPKATERLNKLDKKRRDGFTETQNSRSYIFFENGDFETSWVSHGSSQLVYGKWELDRNGYLRIVFPDNTGLLYKTVLTESHFILTSSVKDGSEDRRIYLKRLDR